MIDFEKHRFTEFIQCSCRYCGGLVIDGIEFEYHRDEKKRYAFVYVYMVRQKDMHYEPGFIERLKLIWDFIRGRRMVVDDFTYDQKGVEKLRDACEVALAHWPTQEELDEPPPSLEEIYAKLKKENEVEN
jgi:hypothetical protein